MTPLPLGSTAAPGPAWILLAVSAVFFAASLGWAGYQARHRHTPIPLLALAGGILASLSEAWVNNNIKLWYPADSPLLLWTALGHPQPLFHFFVSPGYVGLGAYVAYRALHARPDGSTLWATLTGICLLDLAFELPATTSGAYRYYGEQPFQPFTDSWPLWVAPINATGPILAGFLIYRLEPALTGARRALVTLLVPLAYAGVYGTTVWPTTILIDTDVPQPARWLGAIITIALCLTIIAVIRIALEPATRRSASPTPADRAAVDRPDPAQEASR